MLIDTHAHVNFNAFKDDGDEVVKRALEQNIWLINVGSQYDTSRRAVEYAEKYGKGVFAAVGLHPIHLRASEVEAHVDEFEEVKFKSKAEKFDYEIYKTLAQNDKVVAIGEIGLDYYRNSGNILLQKEVLLEQLSLAAELEKPVIFHCREAYDELLKILKNWNLMGNAALRGVVHSFCGSWLQAKQYLNLGFYLGFNGIITFSRDFDQVVRETPLERLFLETDCPYLTPVPFRGKRNEPLFVKYVAQKVAELRGISEEEVAEATTENAKKLFGI